MSDNHKYLMHLVFSRPLRVGEFFAVNSHIGLYLPHSVVTIMTNTETDPLAPDEQLTPPRGVVIGTVEAESPQAVHNALTVMLVEMPFEVFRLTKIRPQTDESA